MREREREKEKKNEEIELEKFLYFGKLLDLIICVSFWFIFHFLWVFFIKVESLIWVKKRVCGVLIFVWVN